MDIFRGDIYISDLREREREMYNIDGWISCHNESLLNDRNDDLCVCECNRLISRISVHFR